MKQGVLIYALNNEQIDYTELAYYTAKSIKKHLNMPVAIVTDSSDWLKSQHPDYKDVFDFFVKIVDSSGIEMWNPFKFYNVGDKVSYNNTIFQKIVDGPEIKDTLTDEESKLSERVYLGIDIDKWYPDLPYLVGQHVWYNKILYKCHTEYVEGKEFTETNYDVLLSNVVDSDVEKVINKGDIFLHNRVLYISLVDYDEIRKKSQIRLDLWNDIHEREVVYNPGIQYRKYFDGALTHKRLKFKNDIRVNSYDLSPFEETLVIDCDYIVNNDILKYCWKQDHDFLIHKTAVDLSGYRYDPRLHTLSDKSIEFYWATVFYFKKNQNTRVFFELLNHIQDNWNYYRYVYQIEYALYRNDYAFSIAIHIMNGYQNGSWAQDLPGKLYYVIDRDVLIAHNNSEMKFLVEKEKYKGEYTLLKTKNLNVHVMNKFSLSRTIREKENV